MNKEEVLAMESGRKLDGLVAKEIMGIEVEYPFAEGYPYYLVEDKGKKVWDAVAFYSTDIKPAWDIVEKLSDLFPTAIVEVWWGRYPIGNSKRAKCFLWSYGGHIAEVDAKIAPEAICKAALLTKIEASV